ncbi:LAFE_0H14180g1_1 [Lachancea fermentati]|uniref:LAFE_0H14180g1_1 n=1 Tax=Lachancea fermentati TaxID=4955 RepID=A0A1G4MKQ9_LACFM|nr:LAFE_0H14180g1_1 [Lachancea fermentati]
MFLSFYITDTKHSLLFEYLVSYDAPSFKALWSKIQSMTPDLAKDRVTCKGNLGKNLVAYRYYSEENRVNYWCLATRKSNPLESLVFMETFDKVLLYYFDKEHITSNKLINNYDRITLLLNSMIDANEPAISDLNRLREMVPVRNDLAKVINSTASTLGKKISHAEANQMFSTRTNSSSNVKETAVPWRSAGITYSSNELYVDMIEKVHVVFQKKKNGAQCVPVTASIEGQVFFKSHLSGDPVILLRLNLLGHDLGCPALHRCVDTSGSDFYADSLKFIPPDGKFELMQYSIDLDAYHSKSKTMANIGLVTLDYQVGLGSLGDEFEIKVNIAGTTRTSTIENLAVGLHLPALPDECKIKVLRNTHGRFQSSVESNRGTWLFDKEIPTGTLPVLRGCLEGASSEILKSLNLTVAYSNKGLLPSGIRVEGVDIISGMPKNLKPFKGVKYVAKAGDFLVR